MINKHLVYKAIEQNLKISWTYIDGEFISRKEADMGKSIKKTIIDALSNYNLIAVKKEVLSPDKFILHITFDGIIETGKTMTLNQLAKIVIEGFATVNARLDAHDVILKEYGEILKEHTEIFKRNNLK